jgi:hypothetical protein
VTSKGITAVLAASVLLLFAVYFALQHRMLDSGNRIAWLLQSVVEQADSGNWEQADREVKQIFDIWERGKFWVQFNYAEQDYQTFESGLYRLQGAVRVKDKGVAASEAMADLDMWNNFLNIVPGP